MAKLIVIEGPDNGNEHELDVQNGSLIFTSGRDPLTEIPLNDSAISRRHFSLEFSPRGWRLFDLGSRNQTFLNGEAVKEAFLRSGDVVRAGDTELRFENPGSPLESSGVASTIIKELPAGKLHDTLLTRLANIEDSLGRGNDAVAPATDPQKAVRRVCDLFEVYGEIASTTTTDDFFQKLLVEISPILGADRAAVVLREGNRWVVRASHSKTDESGSVNVSSSILEKVVGEEKAVLSEGAAIAKARANSKASVEEDPASVIAAPIAVKGKSRGVLYADRQGDQPRFDEGDLQLLVTACEPAGSLLERLEMEESLRRENRNLFRSLTEKKKIVGNSPASSEILEFIRRAAPTPMTVLILGETGTGKELVSAAIHYSSPRRGRPFVALNCAALPENLVESELFGHERGAFTGAVTRRKGRFELADTGTVFLDEVGELSLPCQAKLLRLLEERQFERVGGGESVKVDVRVIAATNHDLLEAVSNGTFREDLYYRLSVLNVVIPPLRERSEDTLLLAEHFLGGCGGTKKLGKLAQKKLLDYSWPGNVRQLRNVIESAVVLGEGAEIRPEDLVLPESRRDPKVEVSWEPISLQRLEERHIKRVLEHTGGNKKKAAEILGIERCTLYAKLKSYDGPGKKGD